MLSSSRVFASGGPMLHGETKRHEGTRTTPPAAIGQRRGTDQLQQTVVRVPVYWFRSRPLCSTRPQVAMPVSRAMHFVFISSVPYRTTRPVQTVLHSLASHMQLYQRQELESIAAQNGFARSLAPLSTLFPASSSVAVSFS